MRKITKTFIFLAIFGIALSACKKDNDDETTNNPPPAATSCIPDSYSGNYNGTGTLNGTPDTDMDVKITKLSCTSCKVESGTVIENLVSLEQSDDGGYKGKDSDGNEVSINGSDNSINVQTDEISFSGDKEQ